MPAELIQALVVSAAPYSETTLLLRLLTRERGVVRALAKGARGKHGGAPQAYEPFTWIEANLFQRKSDGLGTLTGAQTREGWPWLRSDLVRLAYAGLALEILATLATSSPHEPFHFEEATRFLTTLEHAPGPGTLTCILLLRLLHHAGFLPWLSPEIQAARAAGQFPARVTYHFHDSLFSLTLPRDPSHAQRLPGEICAAFAGADAHSINFFETQPTLETHLPLNPRTGPQAVRWLIRVWEDHLQTRFTAAEFLEKMVLAPTKS